jgi:hypothetical protein
MAILSAPAAASLARPLRGRLRAGVDGALIHEALSQLAASCTRRNAIVHARHIVRGRSGSRGRPEMARAKPLDLAVVQTWLSAWNERDIFSDAAVRHVKSLITDPFCYV